MKSKIIGLSILAFVVLLIISFLNRVSIKNIHNFSDSKQTSKQNGFFVADYFPTKTVLKLKNWPVTVTLDSAWTEHQWTEVPGFLNSTLEKSLGGYNIAFKIKNCSTEDFVYSLDIYPDNIGTIGGYNPMTKQHEGFIYSHKDTLTILVQEKNPIDSIGWQKHLTTDTILYIRCKNKY